MANYIVDNIAGILPHEKSVLDVFRDRISRALDCGQQISFHIAVGFFFFEGFRKLYPTIRKLYEAGLLREFRLVMGPETRKTTKEVLEALKSDAIALDDETFDFLKDLYDEGKFDFRIFLERRFHIKLYLFEIGNEIEIWAGSANLTGAGLEENIELIVPTAALTFEDRDLYRRFFDEMWKRSTDEVENLKVMNVIRDASRSEAVYLHPRDFIVNLIKLLGKEYLIKNISADLSYLAEFQNMSYYLSIDKLNKYGGGILANSFGLGKTDVGCMIARYYKELGKKVLLVYPPVIRGHWRRTLEKVGLKEHDVQWLSRGILQKSDLDYEEYRGIDLVIVDEAHHFRVSSPKSNRRENLESIIKINPKCHVLLVTATPINTSLLDFIELLKLFVKGNFKEKFETEGLLLRMREIERSVKEKTITEQVIEKLNELIRAFSVRIEWPDLPLYFKQDLKRIANVEDIEAPDVFPKNYRYDEEIAENVFDRVVPFLSKLNFEYTKLWERKYKEDKNLIWWFKWRLYKRLESSITAFRISLRNIQEKDKFLLRFLKKVSASPNYERKTNLFSKERLQSIKNTFLTISNAERKKVLKRIERDITLIEGMLKNILKIRNLEERDEKIKKLFEILEEERKPALVFSESRDTVVYIGRRLKKHGKFRFEMAYGGEAPIDEETGERIKTIAYKEDIERKFNEGEFDVLVSTDIMGEGVNLPRADVVINFDLHYNPVRLIQRDGRAIRINNPKKIAIYNFEPDERIDKELDLCDRLAERVENIISTIGLDFLIWSIEEEKVEEFSEENRKRIVKLIREYKDLLASKTPEDLKKGIPPTLSKEDKALREFIKFWAISEETVETRARTLQRPIFTGLKKQASTGYFIVFKYRGSLYTVGELSFSENKLETRLSREERKKIEGLVDEKRLQLDKEFLKISYRGKDKLTRQIEGTVGKIKELADMFEDIDIQILPRKYRQEILRSIKKIEKTPPWKREREVKELQVTLGKKIKTEGYPRSLQSPKLLAVIKYG